MTEHYDIAIIGAGPGGYSTALRAAQLGSSVVLVERDAKVGGTCLNRGCIPSKALIEATHTLALIRDGSRMGINASAEPIDFERLTSYRQDAVASMTNGLSSLLSARGVTVVTGCASMTDTHHVTVTSTGSDLNNGGGDEGDGSHHAPVAEETGSEPTSLVRQSRRVIEADDIVLATGSRPRPLPHNPFGGQVIDSTQALELPRFPESATIVGSGAVALEFASMWRQAGVEVTLLIRRDRVLSGWHRRTSQALTRALKQQGVTIVTHSHVRQIETNDGPESETITHYTVDGDETDRIAHSEVVLAAIGRDPNTDEPWFTANGIKLDERGLVITDPYGRTDLPHVWALGDITAGPALAHRAFAQGIVIAETIAGLNPQPVDPQTVPQVVFTTPQAASVGLTIDEAQADATIANAKETVYPMMGNARVMMSGQPASLALVTGERGDQPGVPVILGVHMLAPDAGDLIAEAEELIGNHVPLSQAARLIHPHPTFAEAMGEALLKADGRPLNTR